MSKDRTKGVGKLNLNHYEIELNMWDVIVVKLSSKATVMLLDNDNYRKYKEGRPVKYYGGSTTESVYRIPAPNFGTWHLVIQPEIRGPIKHSIQIIRN